MKNKILVVGGAGYIGGAVTDLLLQKKANFSVYDNLLYEHQYLKQVDFIYGDVRDYKKLGQLLPKYSHIIWLAAIVGDSACQIKSKLTKAINQSSVEWLSRNYNGRIIFLSTCSVYGKNENEVSEEDKLNPLSLYAKTKMKAEKCLLDKNSIIFRLGTVFGVSDTYSRIRMDLVVNYMTATAITKRKLSVFGGSQWRPLVHVNNVADVIQLALKSPKKGIYNIATSNYQIKDLGVEISKITNCSIEYVKQTFEDQRNYRVSIDKARKNNFLKLSETYSVKYGIIQISDLIKTRRMKYTENDIYFNDKHISNLNINGELDK